MITVGPMALNQPQAADPMEPFFLGTQSGGGYWTDISRLSSHDHSGGLMGAAVAVNIPDGSITAADLDPSVLAPYALTDGSKPFTGQVTMQADAIIRDELLFGPQGSAAAPDVHVLRTGAGALRVDTTLGVGVAPATALDVQGVMTARGAGGGVGVVDRTTPTDTTYLYGTGRVFYVAPVGVARLAVDNVTGSVSVTPAAGQAALSVGGPVTAPAGVNLTLRTQAAGIVNLGEGATDKLSYYANQFYPLVDNQIALGAGSLRYTTVYAVSGAVNASSQDVKTDITPLDPARAMAAVRNTEAVTFDYVAPTRGPEWYDLPDDPEQAEAVLQQRLTAAPLEAAARHQHGFIAEQADELFLVGEGQTSPGSSIGILLAALQNIDQRLAALETP